AEQRRLAPVPAGDGRLGLRILARLGSASFPPTGHFRGVSAGGRDDGRDAENSDGWHCTLRFRGRRYYFAAGNLTEEQSRALGRAASRIEVRSRCEGRSLSAARHFEDGSHGRPPG